MLAHKFGLRHKAKLRNTVTSFHESGYTAFDYSAYPLQAYICHGIGLEEDKAAIFQNKLCRQGHIWKDTILSSRCNHPPYNCYVCRHVKHVKRVNSGEYAAMKRERYQGNPDAHNADCLKRYHKNKDQILENIKLKGKERRKAVEDGLLPRFYDGNKCKYCETSLKYTLSKNCVNCTRERARQYANEKPDKVYGQHKLWNAKNAEAVRAYKEKWKENNPDKSREASKRRYDRLKSTLTIGYSKEEFWNHLELFDYQCAYCKESLNFKSKNAWHLDHFIALSKNGTNHLGNYVPACRSCNLNKNDKCPQSWYVQQNFYDGDRWKEILLILWQYQEKYGLYEESILELIKKV